MEKIVNNYIGFHWDDGNHTKNLDKHDVSKLECEQIFFNEPLLLFDDAQHSQLENRMFALGRTDDGRDLFIAFTIRTQLIRVISARDMSRKERRIYDQAEENTEI